jgi:flagellar protein FlaD
MVENEEDSDKKVLQEIELSSELSALVENNIIPKKIANRLEDRLKEKKVKITKGQLNRLAKKISEIVSEYMKDKPANKKEPDNKQLQTKEPEEDTNKMKQSQEIKEKSPSYQTNKYNTAKQLKQNKGYFSPSKVVTTEDISIPGKQIFEDFKLDPLLEIPGDTESIIVLMKWLQNLIDKCGRQNLSNILDYYVEIGWITDDVKIGLIDYSHGITEDDKIGKPQKEISNLPSKDHIESLLFIQKLKGKQFDKHFIDRIEGEINRMTKKIDNYTS